MDEIGYRAASDFYRRNTNEQDQTELYSERRNHRAKLIIAFANGEIKEAILSTRTLIGRIKAAEPNDSTVVIPSPVVSRRHGEFIMVRGEYWFRDLGSRNGTYINGHLYKSHGQQGQVVKLHSGDVLKIQIDDPKHAQKSVIIIFTSEQEELLIWNKLELSKDIEILRIGRDTASEKSLLKENSMVSRSHAAIFRQGNRWVIVDNQSKNGVYINGVRIAKEAVLKTMDVIRIANVFFIMTESGLLYQSILTEERDPSKEAFLSSSIPQSFTEEEKQRRVPSYPAGDQLIIHIKRRSVRKKMNRITLLKDIHLSVNDGEMVVIMGGSGAGKTTFLNAVLGYEKAEGSIRHGKKDLYRDYEDMKYEIGYVTQDNLIRMNDTVYKTLEDAASMKLPRYVTAEFKRRRIHEVLELLGLERESQSLASKLSGGQKKRLSIAVEYIADPKLFFLDEPDSGLDGVMAATLFQYLRTIADTGKIVMVISHAPDRAIELFDKVIVLAKGTYDNCGHLAFYGSPQEAKVFFGTPDLESILRKINRPDEGGEGKSDYYIRRFEERNRISG